MGCKVCKYKPNDEDEIIRSARGAKIISKNQKSKINLPEYKNEILTLINKYRSYHNSPPLKENESLTEIAQNHSENISSKGKVYLSNNTYKGEKLGESIFASSKLYTPKDLVEKWYNTQSEHIYGNENTKPTNFAQMVWKNSTDFGLGICHKIHDKGYCYIVANYYPGGNVSGQFCNNVFPRINNDNNSNLNTNFNTNLNTNFSNNLNNVSEEIDLEYFRKKTLECHNKFRNIHHCNNLVINEDLNKMALDYAKKISQLGKLQHSNEKYKGNLLGENLFYCKGFNINGVIMTENWYNEIKNYDFNSNNFISGTGHFTQVVWKDSKECGFGYAKSNDGAFYGVAKYYPAGNFQGKFKENVLPK